MNTFTTKIKIELAEGMTIKEINNPDSEKYTLVLSNEDNELYGLGNRTIIKLSEEDINKYECISASKFTDKSDYFIIETDDGEKVMNDNELLSFIKDESCTDEKDENGFYTYPYPFEFAIRKVKMSREDYIVASNDYEMRYISFRDSIASKYKELKDMCVTYVVQSKTDSNINVAIFETPTKDIEPTQDHYKGTFDFTLEKWEKEKLKNGNRVFIENIFTKDKDVDFLLEVNQELKQIKEKFKTGKYICLFTNKHISKWHIDIKPSFIDSNKYKLVLKKHEKFLNAYLVGRKIEYNSGYGWNPMGNFIDRYAEHISYRIKNPKATLENYTSISWSCVCGYPNIEEEGQLDLEDGENVFCSECNKEYIFNKTQLEFIEYIEN